jgi:hypothetical protein
MSSLPIVQNRHVAVLTVSIIHRDIEGSGSREELHSAVEHRIARERDRIH